MSDRSDRDLVHAFRRGDSEAYACLMDRYSGRIFALCYNRLGNVDDAEDVTQETFLKVYLRIHQIYHGQRFFPWAKRIAKNLCTDLFRTRQHAEILVADVPERPDRSHRINTDHIDLRRAIDCLPEQFRRPVRAYYFDGRTAEQIARDLKIHPVTVRTRLSRARKQLRRLLNGNGNGRSRGPSGEGAEGVSGGNGGNGRGRSGAKHG